MPTIQQLVEKEEKSSQVNQSIGYVLRNISICLSVYTTPKP